jgi:hypothetical protein
MRGGLEMLSKKTYLPNSSMSERAMSVPPPDFDFAAAYPNTVHTTSIMAVTPMRRSYHLKENEGEVLFFDLPSRKKLIPSGLLILWFFLILNLLFFFN